MFFFVILGALNLTVFVKYYCIQKSKLKLGMGFAMFHINLQQWRTAVGTYRKSVILIKKGPVIFIFLRILFAFTYQSSLCYTFLFVFCFIRSNLEPPFILDKINSLTGCCLSLHFLWILYFALRLLQHGDIELNPGLNTFLSVTET